MLKRVSSRSSPTLSLVLQALNPSNSSLSASMSLKVNVNAFAGQVLPKFMTPTVVLTWEEGKAVPAGGLLLTDLITEDEKSGIPVVYSLVSGDSTHFRVEASTGKLYILKTLDREAKASYVLQVSSG